MSKMSPVQQRIRSGMIRSLSGMRGQISFVRNHFSINRTIDLDSLTHEQQTVLGKHYLTLRKIESELTAIEDSLRDIYKFKPRSF